MKSRIALAFARLLAPALLAVAGLAHAQGLQKTDSPLELKASPALVTPGGAITLSGTTAPVKDAPVTFSIKPAQGAAQALSAKPGPDGSFSVKFTGTKATGRYDVTATAPDGKVKAQASFVVGTPGAVAQELKKQVKALMVTVQQAQAVGDDLIATLPPSPALAEAQKKSAALKAKLADGPAVLDQFGKAVDALGQAEQKYPEARPVLQPLFDQLADEAQKIEEQDVSITSKINKSKAQGVKCDMLDAANEAFNTVSFGLDLVQEPINLVKNFVIDKVPGPALDLALSKSSLAAGPSADSAKAGVLEAVKFSATALLGGVSGGPLSWAGMGIGLANDLAQFVTAKVFGKYCDKFEGPMDATFRVELRNNDDAYLQYLVQMKGKLVLRYAKSEDGKSATTTALNGQIEGNATSFKAWEEAWRLQPDIKNKLMARLLFAPPGWPYTETTGTVARAASPGNFYIPVHGQMVNGKVTLQVDPARNDFTDLVRVRLYYVVAALVPQIVMVELPVQKAFFIFDRGTHSKPAFTVKTDSSASTIEDTFKRHETVDSGQVDVQWVVHLKACNPGCLPIGL